MRKRSYFYYNGNNYYAGTKMLVKDWNGDAPIEVTFKCHNVDSNDYVYTNMYGGDILMSSDLFYSRIIKIIEQKDLTTLVNELEASGAFDQNTIKDSQIDGLLLGWIWYIFLMAISTIFNDRIGLWILISIVFFGWRNAKRNSEATD